MALSDQMTNKDRRKLVCDFKVKDTVEQWENRKYCRKNRIINVTYYRCLIRLGAAQNKAIGEYLGRPSKPLMFLWSCTQSVKSDVDMAGYTRMRRDSTSLKRHCLLLLVKTSVHAYDCIENLCKKKKKLRELLQTGLTLSILTLVMLILLSFLSFFHFIFRLKKRK